VCSAQEDCAAAGGSCRAAGLIANRTVLQALCNLYFGKICDTVLLSAFAACNATAGGYYYMLRFALRRDSIVAQLESGGVKPNLQTYSCTVHLTLYKGMENQLGKIQNNFWDLTWSSGLYLDLIFGDFIFFYQGKMV